MTQAHYIHSRNTRNIGLMIALVWVVSVVVSLAPLVGWKDGNWSERVEAGKCIVSIMYIYHLYAGEVDYFSQQLLQ